MKKGPKDATDGRVAKGEQTRKKLLAGVVELAAEHGLQGVTAGQLSKRVGVSKSAIFHHFDSIDALSIEAMRGWFDESMQALDAEQPRNVREYFENLGEAMFAQLEQPTLFRATMAFLHHGLFDAAYRKALQPFLDGYTQQHRVTLASLLDRSVDDPLVQDWVTTLTALLDGLAVQAAITEDLERCRRAWAAFVKALTLPAGEAALGEKR